MRPDMNKVITERARVGARLKQRKGSKRKDSKIPLEEKPKRAPLCYKNDKTKEFSDVLGPLRGYVFKQIGRPFSKVKSEISKVLRATGVSGSHAQDHLWQMLVTKVIIIDGRPCHSDIKYRPWNKEETYLPIEYGGYHRDVAYVDPRDGIIKRAPLESKRKKSWKEQKQDELPIIWIDELHYYRKIFDCWFWVELKPLPPPNPEQNHSFVNANLVYDVIMNLKGKQGKNKNSHFPIYYDRYAYRNFHGKEVYAVSKRQLSSREIKKLNLNS